MSGLVFTVPFVVVVVFVFIVLAHVDTGDQAAPDNTPVDPDPDPDRVPARSRGPPTSAPPRPTSARWRDAHIPSPPSC